MRFFKNISLLLPLVALIFQGNMDATDCCLEYAYNYPTRFQEGCCLWEGHLDALYLEARNGFAPVEIGVDSSSSFTPKELNYDWKAGFRVGIGLDLPGDWFSLDLDWLHYRTDARLQSGLNGDSSNFVVPYLGVVSSTSTDNSIFDSNYSSYSRLHLNEITLSIHREYILTPGIVLSPKIGVNYLDIKSTLALTIVPSVLASRSEFNSLFLNINTLNRFYGLGIKGGLDSMWNVGCGFGIYSELQAGLIWGRYQTTAPFTTNGENGYSATGDSVSGVVRYVHHNLVPTLDFGIGIIFDNRFADGSEIRLKAGWEGLYYYDQTTINLEPELLSRPLTLHGLVLSLAYSM